MSESIREKACQIQSLSEKYQECGYHCGDAVLRAFIEAENIELPQDMKRAMAKEAEAERERRANVISADGEKQASQTLAEAAEILANSAGAINLRTLNTLERISTEPSQKTMILFPIEILDALRNHK